MFNIPTSEIEELWKMVFNIALHTLRNPAEAEDATQEIFEKVVRNYGSFQGNAKLSTWVYRIAYNHLIDMRRSKKTEAISFELFEQDVSSFAPYKGELGLSKTEEKLYAEEVKVGCTLALLQCLKREERLAFILGTIFEFSANQAAKICEVTPTTYRKRLSRAKHKIKNFMQKKLWTNLPQCPLSLQKATAYCL